MKTKHYQSNPFRILGNIFTFGKAKTPIRPPKNPYKPEDISTAELMKAALIINAACDDKGKQQLAELMLDQVERAKR